jgi:alpha-methylacyl-CoA racemase
MKVVELGGIGPSEFAGMMLADLGAEVIRIDRVNAVEDEDWPSSYSTLRGRRSVAVDLKDPAGVELVLRLVDRADVLTEGFRPGVAERLGLGPETCTDRNPRLVYTRITGWGQDGPYAQVPGHDINYLAVTGCLNAFGRIGQIPLPPLNLLGDYGGGGMLAVVGILGALFERQHSESGQVVDAAVVDGVSLLTTLFWGMRARGEFNDERGTNTIDGGSPFYEVYETADGGYVAVGAGEPQFFDVLMGTLGIDDPPYQWDRASWPELKVRIAQAFKSRTRDEWTALVGDARLCISPVLGWEEAPENAQNTARGVYVEHDGLTQPAPAPRFARTPASLSLGPPKAGQNTEEVLADWGIPGPEIRALLEGGIARQRS